MNVKSAQTIAKKTLDRVSNYANHRRLNGVSIKNYVYHIGNALLVTSKKYFYIGFSAGFLFALASFMVVLMLKKIL